MPPFARPQEHFPLRLTLVMREDASLRRAPFRHPKFRRRGRSAGGVIGNRNTQFTWRIVSGERFANAAKRITD